MGKIDKSCDIVLPVFNRPDLTRNCLESIYANTDTPFDVIMVDNGSGRETTDMLEGFKASRRNITIVRNPQNLGWIKAVNQGIELSRHPYICIMNNDTVVRTAGWLSGLMDVADSEGDIGLVNPRFDARAPKGLARKCIEIDFCRGYCVLIKRNVIEKIGKLDEAYGMGYYDDDDYSVRAIRAGFRCVRANDVAVEHIRDSTFSDVFGSKRRKLHEANKALFYSRWGRRLRIVFITDGRTDKETLSDILFWLARRQHIIYLWNMGPGALFEHINIREKAFPAILGWPAFIAALLYDKLKRASKRYDVVFTDDRRLGHLLSAVRRHVYAVDPEKDRAKICGITDSAAKA